MSDVEGVLDKYKYLIPEINSKEIKKLVDHGIYPKQLFWKSDEDLF